MNFNYQTIQKSKDSDSKDIYKLALTSNKYLYIKDSIIYDIKSYYSNDDCNIANHKVTTLKDFYNITENYTSESAAANAYKKLPFIITMELKNGKIVFINLENYISDGWKIEESKISNICNKDLYDYIKETVKSEIEQDILNRKLTGDDALDKANELLPNFCKPSNIDNIYDGSNVDKVLIGNGTSGVDGKSRLTITFTKDNLTTSIKNIIVDEAKAAAKQVAIKILKSYGYSNSTVGDINITL